MKQNRQGRGRQGDPQNETVLRQKRFALVLCGDEALATKLVARLASMKGVEGAQNLAPSALQFFRFQKLYELWMGEVQSASTDLRIFQPGHENEAIEKGLDPLMARVLGGLPSLHRAVLLLIYGENFSYAATAQLLHISVEELMGALSAARQGFLEKNQRGGAEQPGAACSSQMPGEVKHEASYDTAC